MPLTGVRILDLSRLLPGPFATMVLAGLGADIVKVEDLGGGDYMRWMPPLENGTSVMFTALNRGKRSLRLDLRSTRGRDLFLDLAERADVVLESFRPGVMARMRLGLDDLHARNPRLVLCSLSGYGQDGPDRLRAGHDLNYLSRAGVMAITGTADGVPVIPGVQIADVGGGSLSAVAAILAALRLRDRTGAGSHCDVSMTDGALSWMAPHLAAARHGAPAAPSGMLLNGAHPCYRLYRCADGWMSVAALEPKFWGRLCELLELTELVDQGLAAGADAQRVAARVEEVMCTRTRAEWRAHLAGEDVCCEPVLSVAEVDADPQAAHRAEMRDDAPSWFPFRVGEHGHPPTGTAPPPGADGRAILAEVGIGEREYDELVATGVTG